MLKGIITTAWYPYVRFRLSFGNQDQVGKAIQSLMESTPDLSRENKVPRALLNRASENERIKDLLRYVPYRLIRPFFPNETKGLADQRVNETVAELSKEFFTQRKPLYRIIHNSSGKFEGIVLHQSWLAYLYDNAGIVKSWIRWEWLRYMQTCNPSVPNIAEKLIWRSGRPPLTKMRRLFTHVIQQADAGSIIKKCIYTNKTLDLDNYAVDHFIPWSFVGHNQPWNLVPTFSDINSSKSDRVPASSFLSRLCDYQFSFTQQAQKSLTKKVWSRNFEEPLIADLRITNFDAINNKTAFQNAFMETLQPLANLAVVHGFSGHWRPS